MSCMEGLILAYLVGRAGYLVGILSIIHIAGRSHTQTANTHTNIFQRIPFTATRAKPTHHPYSLHYPPTMTTTHRLPSNSVILVTGANGYIASHVVDILLKQGYRVRGTVRAEKPWLNKLFGDRHGEGKFETVLVPSLEAQGAYDEAVRGVAGIVHVVSFADVRFCGRDEHLT